MKFPIHDTVAGDTVTGTGRAPTLRETLRELAHKSHAPFVDAASAEPSGIAQDARENKIANAARAFFREQLTDVQRNGPDRLGQYALATAYHRWQIDPDLRGDHRYVRWVFAQMRKNPELI
jgi:hypothetical protein